jgi:hypothetical protein
LLAFASTPTPETGAESAPDAERAREEALLATA